MKILLAEDDLNLGKLMSMLLKKQNIPCRLGRIAVSPVIIPEVFWHLKEMK